MEDGVWDGIESIVRRRRAKGHAGSADGDCWFRILLFKSSLSSPPIFISSSYLIAFDPRSLLSLNSIYLSTLATDRTALLRVPWSRPREYVCFHSF